MNKQIEEMAWNLCDIPKHPSIKSCEQCGNKHCLAMYYAKRACNNSYRKQSRGEWVYGKLGGQGAWVCSLCGAGFTGENAEWIAKEHDFCPKCGAYMKHESEGAE